MSTPAEPTVPEKPKLWTTTTWRSPRPRAVQVATLLAYLETALLFLAALLWLILEQLAGGFGPDGPTVTWQWLTSVAAGSLGIAHAGAGWGLSQGLGRTPLIVAAVIAIGGHAWELSLGLIDVLLVLPGLLVPVAIIVLCLLPSTSQWLAGFRARRAG